MLWKITLVISGNNVALTELQFAIINAMMDDYEDLEQIFLGMNREALEATREPNFGQPRYRLVEIVDEIPSLLEQGLIRAHILSSEGATPLSQVDQTRIHDYWFAPTRKGKGEWKNHQR
jgi:hypothetical protein